VRLKFLDFLFSTQVDAERLFAKSVFNVLLKAPADVSVVRKNVHPIFLSDEEAFTTCYGLTDES